MESNATYGLPSGLPSGALPPAGQPESSREDYTGRGPKGFRRSDERIRENVSEALYYHKDIDASEIEVGVKDAVVTLRGSVANRFQKYLAEDVADSIPGVEEIRNHISVRRDAMRPFPGYHWV
jgi:osmotically-inducible protein OsmY